MTDFVYDTHLKVRDSSSLTDVWYSTTEQKLFVKFKSTGTVAGYSGVSPYAWGQFKKAVEDPWLSAGSFYSRNIKPVHRGIDSNVNFVDRKKAALPTAADNGLSFTIAGYAPVSVTVRAKDMAEAIELFRQAHPNAKVSEAAVKFA